jgi:hypothetical protein
MFILICLALVIIAGAVAWYALERNCGNTPETNPNWPFPKDKP